MAAKKKTDSKRKAIPTSETHVVEERQIAPKKLQKAIADSNAILESNSERAGVLGGIKREAAEQGMDPQAFGMLLRLWRKGQNNPATLGSILRSFDYGREVLGIDNLVPADLFEEPTEGKKTHRAEEVALDYDYEDQPDNVEVLDEHRPDAA